MVVKNGDLNEMYEPPILGVAYCLIGRCKKNPKKIVSQMVEKWWKNHPSLGSVKENSPKPRIHDSGYPSQLAAGFCTLANQRVFLSTRFFVVRHVISTWMSQEVSKWLVNGL